MRSRDAVFLVARREYVERVQEKSFVISIVVTVAIILAAVVLPPLIFGDDGTRTVGLVGATSAPYADVVPELASSLDLEVTTETLASRRAAEAALEDGEVDAVVVDGERLLTSADADDPVRATVQAAAQQIRAVEQLRDAGLAPEEAAGILDPAPLEVRDPSGVDEQEADASSGLSFIVALVLYGQILGFCMAVASGIVEEKATRVVEILLATVRPGQLLAGKIIGIGLVGLTQLVLMAGVGLGAVLATGVVDLPPGAPVAIAQGFLWFLLGYLFYACAYATLSSLVSRQEEVQNVTTPITIVILAAFFLSFTALEDPGSTIARVASLVPGLSPIVMPARGAAASLGEVAIAVALTLACSAGLVVLAGKVYARGVLRTGSRVKLREVLGAQS